MHDFSVRNLGLALLAPFLKRQYSIWRALLGSLKLQPYCVRREGKYRGHGLCRGGSACTLHGARLGTIQRRDYRGCALSGASIHTLRVAHLAWVRLWRRSAWRGQTYLGPRSSNVVPVMGARCVERT